MNFGAKAVQRCSVVFALALLLTSASALPANADAGFFGPLFHMFSEPPEIHLPRPEIHLPHLDFVPFWTSDLKIGRAAYSKGDYERARGAFLKSSDDGNIVADWYLGHMYRLGQGVPVDSSISYSYFKRVADTYSDEEQDATRLRIAVDAQIRVADFLRTGITSAHLKANPQQASRIYLQMATNYGHPRALYALGAMNLEGDGIRQNPQQGLKWLYAAARKRSPEAAAYLGDLCAKGGILTQDETRALTWYIIAAGEANKNENPQIFTRLSQMQLAAEEETKLEAEARARVWNDQNPAEQ